VLDRILTLELVRVTERAAVAAARLCGRGDELATDQAAVDAMRAELARLPIDGTVVIGEGERNQRRCGSTARRSAPVTGRSWTSRSTRYAGDALFVAHGARDQGTASGLG
jgi:hypothetical protein